MNTTDKLRCHTTGIILLFRQPISSAMIEDEGDETWVLFRPKVKPTVDEKPVRYFSFLPLLQDEDISLLTLRYLTDFLPPQQSPFFQLTLATNYYRI